MQLTIGTIFQVESSSQYRGRYFNSRL